MYDWLEHTAVVIKADIQLLVMIRVNVCVADVYEPTLPTT